MKPVDTEFKNRVSKTKTNRNRFNQIAYECLKAKIFGDSVDKFLGRGIHLKEVLNRCSIDIHPGFERFVIDGNVVATVIFTDVYGAVPWQTRTTAAANNWSDSQIIAATKAAMAGRSIGWQIAVARRAGYGF